MPNKPEEPGAKKIKLFSMAIRIVVDVALGAAIGALQNHKSKNKELCSICCP
jgi:hypothetical protein